MGAHKRAPAHRAPRTPPPHVHLSSPAPRPADGSRPSPPYSQPQSRAARAAGMCASRLVEAGARAARGAGTMVMWSVVTWQAAWRARRPRREESAGRRGRRASPLFAASRHAPSLAAPRMLASVARRAAARLSPRSPGPPPLRRRAVAASAAGLDPPDVRKLAEMAHIDVTDAEVCVEGGEEGRGSQPRP